MVTFLSKVFASAAFPDTFWRFIKAIYSLQLYIQYNTVYIVAQYYVVYNYIICILYEIK